MNHSYRVVFNETTNTYTAVAEIAKARGKSAQTAVVVDGAARVGNLLGGTGNKVFALSAMTLAMMGGNQVMAAQIDGAPAGGTSNGRNITITSNAGDSAGEVNGVAGNTNHILIGNLASNNGAYGKTIVIGSTNPDDADEASGKPGLTKATKNFAIAIGSSAQSHAVGSATLGTSARANGEGSIGLGYHAKATATHGGSVALGYMATATETETRNTPEMLKMLNWVDNTTGQYVNRTNGGQNTSIGYNSYTGGFGDVAVGSNAKVVTRDTAFDGTRLVVEAKGDGITSPLPSAVMGHRAVAGSGAGNVIIGAHATNNFGQAILHPHSSESANIKTSVGQSTAIGSRAFVYGDQATALGADTSALGHSSIAIGGDDIQRAKRAINENLSAEFAARGINLNNMETVLPVLNARTGADAVPYVVQNLTRSNIDSFSGERNAQTNAPNLTDSNYNSNPRTASVGDASIAMGAASQTAGTGAMAIGVNALAFETASISQGVLSRARGINSLAIGSVSEAGANSSNAIGHNARALTAHSVALGTNTVTEGHTALSGGNWQIGADGKLVNNLRDFTRPDGTVVKIQTETTSDSQIAIGNGAKTTTSKINGNFVPSQHAIAIGTAAYTEEAMDMAIGAGATVQRKRNASGNLFDRNGYDRAKNGTGVMPAIAMGFNAQAGGAHGDVIIGAGASSNLNTAAGIGQATAVGSRAFVYGDQALAIGADTRALGDSSIAIGGDDIESARPVLDAMANNLGLGKFNVENVRELVTKDTNSLKADEAQKLLLDGKANTSGAIFVDTAAVGDAAISVGAASQSLGVAATSVGANALSYGTGSVAIGTMTRSGAASSNADATASNTVAIGTLANATGDQSIAIGLNSAVTGKQSIAIGVGNKVTGNNSGVFGDPTVITGNNAYSVGNDNAIASNSAFTLGNNNQIGATAKYDANGKLIRAEALTATADAHNSTVIGSNNHINSENTFVLGNGVNTKKDKDATGNVTIDKLGTTVANSVYLGSDTTARIDEGKNLQDSDYTEGTTTTAGATGTVNEANINGISYGKSSGSLAFAGATGVGAVTVGAAGAERRIMNLAAGEITATSTDAINGSQLYAVITQSGFNVVGDNGTTNFINNGDKIKFTGANVTTETTGGVTEIKITPTSTGGTTAQNYFHTNAGASIDPVAANNLGVVDATAGAGGQNSLAAGIEATTAKSAEGATAIGYQTSVAGKNSVAIGKGAKVVNQTGGDARAAIAIGENSQAENEKAIAIGGEAQSSGNRAMALGDRAQATARNAVAMGNQAQSGAENATAINNNALAYGNSAVAIGNGAMSGFNGHVTGVVVDEQIDPLDPSKGTRKVVKNPTPYAHSVAVGTSSIAAGNQAVAIGREAKALASNTLAFGEKAQATQNHAIAAGSQANAAGVSSIAMGQNAKAGRASATGVSAANNAIAIGTNAEAVAAASGVALGQNSKVESTNALALGASSQVLGTTLNNAVALGAYSEAREGVSTDKATINGIEYGNFAGKSVVHKGSSNNSMVVSVGSVGSERQIQNVAAGQITETSTDAINGSQLYSVLTNGGWDLYANNTTDAANKAGTVNFGNKVVFKSTSLGLTVADIEKSTVDGSLGISLTLNEGVIENEKSGSPLVPTGKVKIGVDGEGNPTTKHVVTTETVVNAINNAGFNIAGNGTKTGELMNAGDTLNFVNGGNTQAVAVKEGTGNKVAVHVTGLPIGYVTPAGEVVAKVGDYYYKVDADGKPDMNQRIDPADVKDLVANVINPDTPAGTSGSPTTLGNLKGNLAPSTSSGDLISQTGDVTASSPTTRVAPLTTADAQKINNNAATVGDVLNAGWNLKTADKGDLDFVRPYDTVNFVNGNGTTVTSSTDGAESKIQYNVAVDNSTTFISAKNAAGDTVYKHADGKWYDAAGTEVTGANAPAANAPTFVSTKPVAATQTGSIQYNDGNTANTKNTASVDAGKVAPKTGDENKVATVENVAEAINASGFKLTASAAAGGKEETGGIDEELINPADTVEIVAGKNLSVKQEANGKITLATQDEVTFKTVSFTDGANPATQITSTDKGINLATTVPAVGGGTPTSKDSVITGVQSGLTTYITGKPTGLVDLSVPTTGSPTVSNNTVATVGDLRNMGFIVSSDKTTSATAGSPTATAFNSQVKNAGEVKFVGTGVAKVSGEVNGDVNTITVHVDPAAAVENTNLQVADGKVTTPNTTSTGGATPDANKYVQAGNLADTINKTGFTVKQNGNASTTPANDLINAGDSVNFADGTGTTAKVETTATGATVKFDVNKAAAPTAGTDGKITAATGTPADSYLTANDTINAINQAGFKVVANDAAAGDDLINAGDKLNFKNGTNTTVAVAGNAVTVNVVADGTLTPATSGSPAAATGKITATGGDDKLVNAKTVAEAINASGFKLTASATADGKEETGGIAEELINPADTVEIIAGKNLSVKQEANGKITLATQDEVTFKTVSFTDGTTNPATQVSSTANGINFATTVPATGGGTPTTKDSVITGVQSGLTTYTTGKPTGLVDLSVPTTGSPTVSNNTVATVGDLRNMGWVVSSDKTTGDLGTAYNDQVRNANEVKFVGTNGATVSGKTDANGVRVITVDVQAQNVANNAQLPVVYTNKDGDKVVKANDGNFYKAGDVDASGSPIVTGGVAPTKVDAADIIASVNSAGDQSKDAPTTLANVQGTLNRIDNNGDVKDPLGQAVPAVTTGQTAAPNSAAEIADMRNKPSVLNRAATVGDVLNSGFNLQNNGAAKDFVRHGDTVNFVNGGNTKVNVVTEADGLSSKVSVNVVGLPVSYTNAAGVPVVKIDDKYYTVDDQGNPTTTEVQPADLVTNVINPNAKPNEKGEATTLGNVKGNLAEINDAAQTATHIGSTTPIVGSNSSFVAPDTVANVNKNNAATVGDVLNAGWNLKANGEAKDFVRHTDTVDFINGNGTTVTISNTNGTGNTIRIDSPLAYADAGKITDASSGKPLAPTNAVQLVGADKDKTVSLGNVSSGVAGKSGVADGKAGDGPRSNDNKTDIANAIAAATGTDLNNAANIGDVQAAMNNTGLKFSGDTAAAGVKDNTFTRTNQQETHIVGGQTDVAKLSTGNIGVVSDGEDTLTVQLSKELNDLTYAHFKDKGGNETVVGGSGVAIVPAGSKPGAANNVTLSVNGLNNGGNQITNVASGGDTDTNGANIGDIKRLIGSNGGFSITADNADTGINKADGDKVAPGGLVKFTDSGAKNIITTVKDNEITFGLNKDITVGNNTTGGSVNVGGDTGITISSTPATKAGGPVTNTISNLTGNLKAIDPVDDKQHAENDPAALANKINNAATVGDVLNAGWNIQNNGTAIDAVTHNNNVDFVDGRGTSVSVTSDGVTNTIQVDSALGYVNTNAKDTSTPSNTVKLYGDEKNPAAVQITNVASGVRNPDGSTPADADRLNAIKTADGATLTNAVNVGDLKVVANDIQASTTTIINNIVNQKIGNTDELITYDASGQIERKSINVVQAIDNINKDGIRFFHTNDDSTTTGTRLSNAVDSSAEGNYATAVGHQANAQGHYAVAMGNGITTDGAVITETVDPSTGDTITRTDTPSKVNGMAIIDTYTYTNKATGATKTHEVQRTRADGHQSVAIGNGSQALGEQSIAIGTGNVVTGKGSVAIGDPNYISGDAAIATGNNNVVGSGADNVQIFGSKNIFAKDQATVVYDTKTGAVSNSGTDKGSANNSGAFGNENVILSDNSRIVGSNSSVGADSKGAMILGNNVTIGDNIANVTALGNGTNVTKADGVALGSNSIANREGFTAHQAVSTQITAAPTSAGTANQVYVMQGATKDDGDAVVATAQNTLAAVSVGGNGRNRQITNVAAGSLDSDAVNVAQLRSVTGALGANINNLGNQINQVDQDAKGGTAQAIATAGLPQAYLPGKSLIAVGAGYYQGQTGYAVGISSISDGGNWIIKGTASGSTRGSFGASAAIGYQW